MEYDIEIKERNTDTIIRQTKEIGTVLFDCFVTCDCGRRVRLILAYRCYYCGIFFCEECAAKHFGGRRPKMLPFRATGEHHE